MNNLLIYILLLLLVIVLFQKKNNIIESFQYHLTNEKILKTKLTFQNMPLVKIYKNENVESTELKKIDKYLNNINIEVENDIEKIKNKENALYYTDSYTYSKFYKNYKILTICSIPKQILFIGNKNIDLLNTVLNIAYLNDIDLELFKIIIKCQKNYSNFNNYNFIKITKNELIPRLFGTDTQTSDLDIFVYFNTILNPLLDELVKQKNFTLISYYYKLTKLNLVETEDNESKIVGADSEYSLDSNLLKFYLPFSKKYIQTISKNNKDLDIESKDINDTKNDNNNFIYNTLLIDTLLFTFNDDTGNKDEYIRINMDKFNKIYLYILNYYNEFLKINYYMQHFEFLNLSKKWALEKQEEGTFNNTMEMFNEKKLKYKINPKNMIVIEITDEVIKYKYNKNIIDGVPLKEGDDLYSEHQGNIKEYKVVSVDDKYTYLVENKKKLDDSKFESLYRCYQDETILLKQECIDIVDKVGNSKPSYNWDRPCQTNDECPFYLSNKNYLNERGGCVSGYCEFPTGLKRKSYRNYDETITESNYPRCHGCDITNDKDCCEKQKNDPKYKSPDYKFNNDNEDRRLSKFF